MNRSKAREIAEKITNEEIKQMFDNAKSNVKDWTKVSIVNKGFSKGAAWNMLASNFDISVKHHILGKQNMIREFGEFLPEHLKPKTVKSNKNEITIIHKDPIF